MNKAFEKILERLEEKGKHIKNTQEGTWFQLGFNVAKEIVQNVAEECNDGWIPCSVAMPEIGQKVIVTSKDGYVSTNIYYDYKHNGDKFPCFHRWDDEMWQCFEPDVVAWQPLPEPYQPEGE